MGNNLAQEQLDIQQNWQCIGNVMREAMQEVAGHLGEQALNERVALMTAAPDSPLGFPLPLGSIVHMHNGLPLSSRTVEEILVDHDTDMAFEASYKRSVERRSPPKYPSRVVVNLLDDTSETCTIVAEKVAKVDPLRRTTAYLLLQADKPL